MCIRDSSYIVRDHDKASFESRLNRLRTLEVETNQKYGTGTVSLTITDSYSNMLEIIEQHPYVCLLYTSETGRQP